MMDIAWESELAKLLSRLSDAQQQLLKLLDRKRETLIKRDHAALSALVPEEEKLCAELQACHERRQHLLEQAAAAGMPADSIRSLSHALPLGESQSLSRSLDEATRRSRLLRHHCVSQWVAMQRTMLHLSHMVEIIATGGQLKPTYGKGGAAATSGALMDQAV
jgi:flagellar biosynthesis/type III secretory pathway chaperone